MASQSKAAQRDARPAHATRAQNPVKKVMRGKKETWVYQPMPKLLKQQYMWICDYLKTNHDQILECKARLEAGPDADSPGSKQDARDRPVFNMTYQTFSKLPNYFIADYFVTHLGMSSELIDKIEDAKSHQVREMLEFFCGVAEGWKWPPVLKTKTVLVDFLDWMISRLGNRHKNFEDCVTDGIIDWVALGPFEYKWTTPADDLPFISKIVPKLGTEVAMKRVRFEMGTDIVMPWSDMRAKFAADDEYQPLVCSFFPKDALFKKKLSMEEIGAKINALADEQKKANTVKVLGSAEVCTSSKKRKAQELKEKLLLRTPASKCRVSLGVTD